MSRQRYLIVIPARRGSSFKGKNTYPLSNIPLVKYTLEASQIGHDVVVSTDCHYVRAEAEAYKTLLDDRPSTLCEWDSTIDDVLNHIRKKYPQYDNYICLQPTSPLRTKAHLLEAIDVFEKNDAECLLSVKLEYKSVWKENGRYAVPVIERLRNRQEATPCYVCNGAIFITASHILDQFKRKLAGKTALYKMSEESSIEIHSKDDIQLAEYFMNVINTRKTYVI